MADTTKAESLVKDFDAALTRFADVLRQPENEFIRDAAIQRFEFCFELGWKSVQAVARLEGQECPSPRMAISTAWRNNWITAEELFLDMLEERNRTSHTYRDSTAKQVFANLPQYLPGLLSLHKSLSSRLSELLDPTPERKSHLN
ncbi:MAG: nucleotidyltransferase substrate binding protein [Acidobacteria bacterium]|nr:nucleotidyltransferase substrate binding protein [Acidobacteriota bacterium]MBI3263339.1 nucleotidyltransferase substrate binding protein [Acidobacteriota bacterium]